MVIFLISFIDIDKRVEVLLFFFDGNFAHEWEIINVKLFG